MIESTGAAQTVEFRLLILVFLVLTRPMASVASGDLVVVYLVTFVAMIVGLLVAQAQRVRDE